MSTPIRKVAIVGASGRLGAFLFNALHKSEQFEVTVIARTSSKAADYPPPTKVVRVSDDYPEAEMVNAFRGHDAVVLSLGFAAERRLSALARASVEAGVKRLIASGYGVDATCKEAAEVFPVAASKAAMVAELRALERPGWSWTEVASGLFLDLYVSHAYKLVLTVSCVKVNFFGINPKEKKAEIWDDGNARFTATTREGISQAVVGILRHPRETANRLVYISTTELSMNELLAAEQKLVGADGWEVTHVKTEEEITKTQEMVATATELMPRLMATGRLGLAVNMLPKFEANFAWTRTLENGMLGVTPESLDQVVRRARQGQMFGSTILDYKRRSLGRWLNSRKIGFVYTVEVTPSYTVVPDLTSGEIEASAFCHVQMSPGDVLPRHDKGVNCLSGRACHTKRPPCRGR